MTKLITDRLDEFELKYILPQGQGEGIVVNIVSDKPLSDIADALEECETLRVIDTDRPGATTLYEGFTILTGVSRLGSGSVRVTLSRRREG